MKKFLLTLFALLMITNYAYSAEGMGRWKEMPITVYIEENRNAYLMKRAFGDWESATNKTVEFEFIENEQEADIVVKFMDKVSDKAERAVGLTYPNIDADGYFVHARIEIAKFSDLSTIKLSNLDLTKIMRHEIGHAIGLLHTNEPYAIMNPTTAKCLNITKYDVKVLKEIYNQ